MGLFNNSIMMGSSGASAYEIERSLRFDDASTTKLNFTPSSAGSRRTFTLSFWIKPTSLASDGCIFEGDTTQINGFMVQMNALGTYEGLYLYDAGAGSFQIWGGTFRDPSAWYHLVIAVDTTQGTDTNRFKVYINGAQQDLGTWSVGSGANRYPGQNDDFDINQSGVEMQIGKSAGGGTDHYQGYLAEFHSIDGTQLTPASFGETNIDTGQWVPIKYAGSYGTNGFYLNFSDNSNTTAGTLGKDSSGNGHNWTPTNFSIAAGKEDDSMIDTPTNNFCTLHPYDRSLVGTISNGNLRLSYNYKPATKNFRGTMALPETGKFYWEWENEEASSNPGRWQTGLVRYTDEVGVLDSDGNNDNNYFTVSYGGSVWVGATNVTAPSNGWSSWPTFYSGERVAIAIDCSNGKVWVGKVASGGGTTWYAADSGTDGNPAAGTNEMGTLPNWGTGKWMPVIIWHDGGAAVTNTFTSNINFGQHSFLGTPPAGFETLSSANLPDTTIKNGTDYFNSVLYTANATTDRALSGVGFSPNLGWFARRTASSGGASPMIFDTVRGATKEMYSAYLNGDDTVAESVKSFTSDGYTLGNNWPNVADTNTWVAWNWKESAVAGFDIVSYEGNGSGPRNISHGLNAKPDLIICKNREQSTNWMTYHSSIGATKFLYLNTNATQMDDTAAWNDTEPTSDVFTVNADQMNNGNNDDIIAYLWTSIEGYSKISSYIGNGNADGTFVYTGFKPAWVIIKGLNSNEWVVVDNKRDTDNPVAEYLLVSTNGLAASGVAYDFVSNGIKFRGTSQNESGNTYLYMAFAEAPFKYANAR